MTSKATVQKKISEKCLSDKKLVLKYTHKKTKPLRAQKLEKKKTIKNGQTIRTDTSPGGLTDDK